VIPLPLLLSHLVVVLLSCFMLGGLVRAPSVVTACAAAVAAEPPMPGTSAGRCAAAWFHLLRDGTADDVRTFEKAYRSAKRLEKRSIDDRVASFPRSLMSVRSSSD